MKLKPTRLLRLISWLLVTALIIALLWFVWPISSIILVGSLIGAFSAVMTPVVYKPSLLLKAFKKIANFSNDKEKSSPEEKKKPPSEEKKPSPEEENKKIVSKCSAQFPIGFIRIATGGFSNVCSFTVKNSQGHTLPLAIKYVSWTPNSVKSESEPYLFLKKETDLLSKIKHENIISTYGSFEGDNYFCLVMPLMDTCLHDLIEERVKPFDGKSIAYIIHCILCALKYLHEAKWVHRDVKPDNVLVKKSKNGYQFFLTDFGLAEPSDQETKHFSGTLPWVSPELYKHFFDEGKKDWRLTSADDIYSATLILCCLCFGLTTPCPETPKWCREQKKFTYEYSPFSLMMSKGQETMENRASAEEMIAMIPTFRN